MSRIRARLLLLTAFAVTAVSAASAAASSDEAGTPPAEGDSDPIAAEAATEPGPSEEAPQTQPAEVDPEADEPAAGTQQPSRPELFRDTEKSTANDKSTENDKHPLGRTDSSEMLWTMTASLLVVLALAVAAWVVFRKVLPRVGRPGQRRVRLLETTYVGPRKAVHILKVGRRRLLVGSSQEGLRMLADVTDALEDDSRAVPGETDGDAS